MTIVDTFSDFVLAVEDYIFTSAPDSWRAGQSAFNLLCRVRPDLADLIRGSDFDPFYQDGNLPEFYGYLCRHWDDDKA